MAYLRSRTVKNSTLGDRPSLVALPISTSRPLRVNRYRFVARRKWPDDRYGPKADLISKPKRRWLSLGLESTAERFRKFRRASISKHGRNGLGRAANDAKRTRETSRARARPPDA
jgi:hypothetical protein